MHCARCHGWVVPEQLSDPHGTTKQLDAVRCLNCGNIEDATILSNRNQSVCRLSSRVPHFPWQAVPLVARSILHGRPCENPDRRCD